MLTRWAWPRGIRWLAGGIVAAVLALAVAWALFVPAADPLAHHDVGFAKGALLQTARDAGRGRLLTLGAGLVAVGALAFTARNFTLSREGQVTDRYTKVIEQLSSDKLDVRIGSIYALERVARDSARDHPTVMEVLTAFVREHSHEQSGRRSRQVLDNVVLPAGRLRRRLFRWLLPEARDQERSTRPDIQAALTVIGRRKVKRDIRRIDLSAADLSGVSLRGADLSSADLTHAFLLEADLRGADHSFAKLRGARFGWANLAQANFSSADLRNAGLAFARLPSAILAFADLTGADLTDAVLTDASLSGANLAGADLTRANLRGAKLRSDFPDFDDANLRGANLTDTNLDAATWPEDAPVPAGWKKNTTSMRLTRSRRPGVDRALIEGLTKIP